MPIQCRLIDPSIPHKERQPGDMWYADYYLDDNGNFPFASKQYNEQWKGKRPPIVIMLPNRHDWVIDMYYDRPDNIDKDGWTITGEVPNLTASPSINSTCKADHKEGYHGWLQNGILSDDLEGRVYYT